MPSALGETSRPDDPTVAEIAELLSHSYTPPGVVLAMYRRSEWFATREGRQHAYDWALGLAEGVMG
jgi:hypothetical protein